MIPPSPITRFAPSPTGYLHLGHLLNALFTWGIARRFGGTVILRLEDHDRGRARPEYEAAILADLEWLGFQPDLGSFDEFRAGPTLFRQSDNLDRYADAARSLPNRYWCECSRQTIARLGGTDPELCYPGTCRHLGLPDGPQLGLRVMMEDEVEEFVDVQHGPQIQTPAAQCGDLLIRDRQGNWTYHFTVTVDDCDQGVNLVIRGEDLLESTGRQIALARMLGRASPPVFLHHALIRDSDGRKLSKRDASTGLRELRAAGESPAEVIGRAAHLGGLIDRQRPIAVDELPDLFEQLG